MPWRVLFMISSMRRGGSEQQTLLLLRHLDRSKFHPHLFLLDQNGEWMSRVPPDVTIHSYDADATRAGFYFPGRILRDQTNQLMHVLRNASIDVVYDRTFFMSMIAGPACSRLAIPRVSTIVSPPAQALPQLESRFLQLKRRRLAKAYMQSRSVVAVSKAAAESAKSYYGLPDEKLTVIHNGVDIEAIAAAARQKELPASDFLTLVCIGRMTAEKGQRDLLEALAIYPATEQPIRLWMIGDGPLRGELQNLALESSGRHQIEFLGALSNPAPYIAAADTLVLPSRFEGMPNVVLEAMALGTPVIATRAGGTLELERDKPTILWCKAGDPKSLADALRNISTDRRSAQSRADNASELVAQYHDIESVTRNIERRLLGEAEL
jgi:glycosyltransferase involved in cell wall biosynthesis